MCHTIFKSNKTCLSKQYRLHFKHSIGLLFIFCKLSIVSCVIPYLNLTRHVYLNNTDYILNIQLDFSLSYVN
ncbi:hypothetical protein LOTGIDRAFT_148303 [Lottia gigantea]|uniref:Uncharacterized protein n=1 Tax=Lottia gigantea TaxID=225164 RepID=V3ZQC9_LOTGI|nr:hypothetical protein LOTGIDRAFT_148303 [Lottia gigantea]ESO84710.1 hypothetical protein LOTGIDRAFT_148303 [Lottia gigantea]